MSPDEQTSSATASTSPPVSRVPSRDPVLSGLQRRRTEAPPEAGREQRSPARQATEAGNSNANQPSWTDALCFVRDPSPSDELYRLGESIRLRMAASSSARAASAPSGNSRQAVIDSTEPRAPFHSFEAGGPSESHQASPSADISASNLGSADFYFASSRPLTENDRRPYRQLEIAHEDLFATSEIRHVGGPRGLQVGSVKDVDLNESEVINAHTSEFRSIGTKALSTCIAICARGQNARGESILGLHHYDGRAGAEDALAQLDGKMRDGGSSRNSYYLVGGMILAEESGLGSHQAEADLLSLRGRYDIQGARLHMLEGEYDAHGNENMLNVVMTPSDLFFSRRDLYESD